MGAVARLAVVATTLAGTLGGGALTALPAHAYGGDGSMNVWQMGLSFNCDSRSACGSDLGGFWGWAELDDNPSTGAHTGDAQFAGCSHGEFNGAGHDSQDITDWYVAPGSAGPETFYVTGVDTFTYRGESTVTPFADQDTGVPAVPGHYSAASVFGEKPPPGISMEIQVSYKPAH